jgi:predicted nuclease of restriction endonuclease-like (RecB) superfamily
MPAGYGETLREVTALIRETRLRTVLSANAAMIQMYWGVGHVILERQAKEGWGAKVIDRLSADLRAAFPEMKGLSPRNLKYMRAFTAAWPDLAIVQRALHKLPWGVNVELLDAIKEPSSSSTPCGS